MSGIDSLLRWPATPAAVRPASQHSTAPGLPLAAPTCRRIAGCRRPARPPRPLARRLLAGVGVSRGARRPPTACRDRADDRLLAGARRQARPHAGHRVRLEADRQRGQPPGARLHRRRAAGGRVRGSPPGGDVGRPTPACSVPVVNIIATRPGRQARGDRARQPLRLAARVARRGRRRAGRGGVPRGGTRAGRAVRPEILPARRDHRRRGARPDGRAGARA